MNRHRLLIISHTEHYLIEGKIVGWGPTVREINFLLALFDTITHVGVLCEGEAPPSALPYASSAISFVPMKPFGGKTFLDKLGVLFSMPRNLKIVREELGKADYFQFRSPTGIGVYLIPWLQYCSQKPGWFKYAGNWVQKNAPLGYMIQKKLLLRNSRCLVTINGKWLNQPSHILSFENPCLDSNERTEGEVATKTKIYDGPLEMCFVGGLTESKGLNYLLKAIPHLPIEKFSGIHIIGDGPLRSDCEDVADSVQIPVKIHGFLSRNRVAEVMKKCHFVILPSKSEGFPKVIAEGANFGCIPIVSNVSALDQYIEPGVNGFLLTPSRLENGLLSSDILDIINSPNLEKVAANAYRMAANFTFDYYHQRIQNELIGETL